MRVKQMRLGFSHRMMFGVHCMRGDFIILSNNRRLPIAAWAFRFLRYWWLPPRALGLDGAAKAWLFISSAVMPGDNEIEHPPPLFHGEVAE